jgi:hypothetical protein
MIRVSIFHIFFGLSLETQRKERQMDEIEVRERREGEGRYLKNKKQYTTD